MAVSLTPEAILFKDTSFPITNSVLTAIVIMIFIGGFFLYYTNKISVKPRSRFQLILESIVLGLHGLAESVMGKKGAKKFFPLIFTFFVMIIFSNWFGLLPLTGSIGGTEKAHEESMTPILVIGKHEDKEVHDEDSEEYEAIKKSEDSDKDSEHNSKTAKKTESTENDEETESISSIRITNEEEIKEPLFRSPSADLNFTLVMAIISFLAIQYAGLRYLGIGYLGKFFDYRVKIQSGWKILLTPLAFLINILWKTLELILELGRIISFTFRLFGNIFAGEVLLFVVTSLTFGIATLPFMGLEIFVGFLQSVVFIFLTMVFIKLAMESHH